MNNVDFSSYMKIYDLIHGNNDVFKQKIKVVELKEIEGKIKLDKDGNTVVDEFGVVQKWDNSYMLTFVCLSNGSRHSCRISQENFTVLKPDVVYIASGYIDYVLFKDAYNSTPVVKFEKFVDERDYLVTQLQIQADLKNDVKAQ